MRFEPEVSRILHIFTYNATVAYVIDASVIYAAFIFLRVSLGIFEEFQLELLKYSCIMVIPPAVYRVLYCTHSRGLVTPVTNKSSLKIAQPPSSQHIYDVCVVTIVFT
jgi:hypothetical protein